MIQIVIRILVSKFRRIHLQSKVRSMKLFSKVLSFFDFSGRNKTVFSNLQISSDDIPFPKNQSLVIQVFVSAFLLLTTIFGAILRYFWFYCSLIDSKYHSFPVPVSENETGKFYFFLPNFETENLFSKNYSRKPETFLGKTETIFGKPGKRISLSVCLSLSLTVCLSLSLTVCLSLSPSLAVCLSLSVSHPSLSHNVNVS